MPTIVLTVDESCTEMFAWHVTALPVKTIAVWYAISVK